MHLRIPLQLAALSCLIVPLEPAAAKDATPVAAVGAQVVAPLPADLLPDEAGPIYVSRATYEPGAGEDLVPDNGLTVMVVETGTLSFVGEGDARLVVAGEAAPAGAVDLAPGSAAILPAGAGGTVANEGTAPATALMVGVYPAEGFVPVDPAGADAPGGTQQWALLGKGSPQALPPPSTLSIERTELVDGDELALDVPGVAVVYVEAGAVLATVEVGLVEASSGAFLRTGGVGPGAAFVGPGDDRRVRAEGSLFVQPGTALTLGNEGDEPAAVLIVRLEPDGGPQGTPAVS